MEALVKQYWVLVGGSAAYLLLVLIAVDWILGIAVALFKNHNFSWHYLMHFFRSDVLWQFGSYLGFGALAVIAPATLPLIGVTWAGIPWATIDAVLIADIVAKWKALQVTTPGTSPHPAGGASTPPGDTPVPPAGATP